MRELTCQSILVSQPCALLMDEATIGRKFTAVSARCSEAKDYIRYRLTGEAYGEMTDFSGTNLVNLYTRDYDARLFGWFGIPEMADKMPPLRSAGSVRQGDGGGRSAVRVEPGDRWRAACLTSMPVRLPPV